MSDASDSTNPAPTDSFASNTEGNFLTRVFVTGGTGFVGRYVVRELVARGHKPVCLIRDVSKFRSVFPELPPDRYELVPGDMFDDEALAKGISGAEAVIHLVGIIVEDAVNGQTFERVHFQGAKRVIDATVKAGVKRYVHMSALGTRANAVSEYHKTKWAAETYLRDTNLDYTIFRPSIIHGPDGEFMQMMKTFVCDATVPAFGFLPSPFPVIPYFGDGENKLQPVSVRDVAHCFVAALSEPETIGQAYDLGGPEPYSWKRLYSTAKELIPCAKAWKPMVSTPVPVAKLLARTVMKLPVLPKQLRFNVGQVQMSQEDSVCDPKPVEETFGIQLRDFREELKVYGGEIG